MAELSELLARFEIAKDGLRKRLDRLAVLESEYDALLVKFKENRQKIETLENQIEHIRQKNEND